MTAPPETGEALDARARVLAIARGELGEQDPNKYYRDAAPQFADRGLEHKVSWCGVFALWCLRQAGLTDATWSSSPSRPGFAPEILKATHDPEPGDVAVFSHLWHHAIVAELPGDGTVRTVDGNTLPAPLEGVAERTHPIAAVFAFYSLRPLIE